MRKSGDELKNSGAHGGRAWLRTAPRRRAFTLVEILVATTVLALLVLLVGQIVQSGSLLISGSSKHLGADAQAREVFSRFDLDLKRMPKRPDLDIVLSSNNNSMFFFCEGPGFYSPAGAADRNTLALVGYRVNSSAQLERLAKGLSWSDPLFLTYTTARPESASIVTESTMSGGWGGIIGSPPAYDNGADPDYHVLADGVFRFFYCFQLKDGTYALTLNSTPLDWKFKNAAAIVLTLAVLDGESRKLVGDTSRLITALPDPAAADLTAGVLPAKLWQDAINNSSQFTSAAGIPAAAAARVRIYQRSFPLDTP